MVAIHGVPAVDLTVVTGDLSTLNTKVDNVQTKCNTIDGKADTVVTAVGTTLPSTLTTIEGKIDTVDTVVDTINGKADTLITNVGTVDTVVDTINGKADTLITNVGTVNTTVNTINTNVNTANTNLTAVQNISLTIPNLSSNINFQGIKQTNAATLTTIHSTGGTGFVHLTYNYPAAASAAGQIQVFVGGTGTANRVMDLEIQPGSNGLIAAFPFWFVGGYTIKAKGDGSEYLSVSITQCKSVSGQSAITIQSSEDNYIDSANPNTNYGTDTWLRLMYKDIGQWRILIKFDISAVIGEFVQSAYLMLMPQSSHTIQDVAIKRLLVDFNETQATWNNRKTGTAWGTPGGQSGVDWSAADDWYGNINSVPAVFDSFDITQLMRDWCQGGVANNGVIIMRKSQNNLESDYYLSNQYGTPGARPKLVYTLA